MNKKTVKDVPVQGRRVLVRVDFNVPLDDQGKITDDTRIQGNLPTIHYLLENGAKVILVSHFGRPKGQADRKWSLAPAAVRLSELLGQKVKLAPDCIGPEVTKLVDGLSEGEVLLLENVRFHPEEEKNTTEFARQLASLADLFVNDAFGVVHRAHASTAGVAAFIPAVAGFLLEKELTIIGKALQAPERPFVAIIGGAKVSDKIAVIEHLLGKVDALIVGGGMANTFIKAQGYAVGKSLVEEDKVELAAGLLKQAKAHGFEIDLPTDVVVAKEFSAKAKSKTTEVSGIKVDEMALDIGAVSAEKFAARIVSAGTVIWNGPMGVFEIDQFAKGTERIAKAAADCRGITIVGGGDSVAAIEKMGLADQITHISTGGGASLELLEGKLLPGVAVLQDK